MTARPTALVRGGSVLGGVPGRLEQVDVAVADGRITAVGLGLQAQPGAVVIDAEGLIVTPGLVDLHTHVFAGQDIGVPAASIGASQGVTTLVDAGSSGAHLYAAFRDGYVRPARERIVSFLNISSIGLTSTVLTGELENLAYADVAECVRCIEENRDTIVGVKARIASDTVGANGLSPLDRAVEAARAVGLPLMVHIGNGPPSLRDIISRLEAGDILTHCCTGLGNCLLGEHGRVRDEALEARERGVILDVGHGGGSFAVDVARGLLAAGFAPDVISSDAHAYSIELVAGLPHVMSRFLALGLPLADVLDRVTSAPAAAVGLREVGRIEVGFVADLAAFEVADEAVHFVDAHGVGFDGRQRIVPRWTMTGGDLPNAASHAPLAETRA